MPRLPELFERDQLAEQARDTHDYILKSRGKIPNSYAMILHAPEVAGRVAHLGSYLRFESSLDSLTIELIALTVSAELDNPYETGIHAPVVAKLGVGEDVIEAIRAKQDLPVPDVAVGLTVACARHLIRTNLLPDTLFDALSKRLDHRGVVDFVASVGYYAMLAYVQNALEVRVS